MVVLAVAALLPMPRGSAAGLLGYNALRPRLRTRSVAIPNDTPRTAKATCPRHQTLLTGGSFFFEPGQPSVPTSLAEFGRLTATYPSGRSWIATGYQTGSGPADLHLDAVALCTKKHIDIETVTDSTIVPALSSRETVESCPWSNDSYPQVLVIGAYLGGSRGDSSPSFLSDLSLDVGVSAGADNEGLSPVDLHLVVRCTKALYGFKRGSFSFDTLHAGDSAGGYLTCSTGSHAMGVTGSALFATAIATDAVVSGGSSPTFRGSTPGKDWFTAVYDINRSAMQYEPVSRCLADV